MLAVSSFSCKKHVNSQGGFPLGDGNPSESLWLVKEANSLCKFSSLTHGGERFYLRQLCEDAGGEQLSAIWSRALRHWCLMASTFGLLLKQTLRYS